MEDFYKKLKEYKESKSITYRELGSLISVSGDAFRMAMNNKTFSDIRIEKLLEIIEKNEKNEKNASFEKGYVVKGDVKISLEEIISLFILNIKEVSNNEKFEDLITAINTVKNITDYNSLNDEIEKIKKLLERNSNLLK
ncbi:hypothetical protein V2647_07645 [Tenacibaculum maritimum]|uniref:hypothetical protein n=1 Tax=Tenacibaculum maritimum TaxID=107401 RepID=UPI0012E6B980|nr:hypothetical protein [Tenacibaculum maritimum]CAA0186679.1 conserved hypothetical protein [Tenacibaculum maritimum]CAA0221834.1 conserved hypothetical protein [Tenacibaculum maritimum]